MVESSNENPTIKLLEPVPEKLLSAWLHEFYGKEVNVIERVVLRHRDFSYVERIKLKDALPDSLIYKLVAPPWDIEQDLHERVLVPSVSSSAQLYLSAHHESKTALFMEDLGFESMKERADKTMCQKLGKSLARMHRAYSYRMEELIETSLLRGISSSCLEDFTQLVTKKLLELSSITSIESDIINKAGKTAAAALKDEPSTLIHGDLYAENIVLRGTTQHLIDWSWFTSIGAALIDLATITSDHEKNGQLRQYKSVLMESYCFESGRPISEVERLCPYALITERLLFLSWLQERKSRGVLGTTVGHVDKLITLVVEQIKTAIPKEAL